METLHDPNAITDAFVHRRTRELEPESEPTGNDFVDSVVGFAGSVASDIWESVRTGEIADGVMLGLTEGAHRGLNLLFRQFDSPAAKLGELVTGTIAGAAQQASQELETGTAKIAAEAAPYVLFGTASVLGGASVASTVGLGIGGKVMFALGASAISDFAVGASMEDPAEENIANLMVQLSELNPDHELLTMAKPIFDFLALQEGDEEATARLKRGATEALTSVAGELGFVAFKGGKAAAGAALDAIKKLSSDPSLGDAMIAMGRRGAALEQEVLAFDGPQINQFYERNPRTPLAVERQIARGAERMGKALQSWEDRIVMATPPIADDVAETATLRLTRAERNFFDVVFGSKADLEELIEQVPSAKISKDGLTISTNDIQVLSDYIDETVVLEQGVSRVPPRFRSGAFFDSLKSEAK